MNNTGNKNALLLFIGSVSFVLLGVFVIAFIGLSPINNSGTGQDIRAKAGVISTIKLTGIVESVDETAKTIKVKSLKFESNATSGGAVLGTWTVTLSNGMKSGLAAGVKIRLSIIPETMIAKTHTMTATAVEIIR